MPRIGSKFEVVAAYNPIGIFPARVYPVYRVSGSQSKAELFRQLSDSKGFVTDYQKVGRRRKDRLQPYFGPRTYNWIDQPAIFGFAMRANEITWSKGVDQYKEDLHSLLAPGMRTILANTPFVALEVARFLKHAHFEALFAGIAVRRLAAVSPAAARKWIAGGPLSEQAKARCRRLLNRPIAQPTSKRLRFPSTRIGYVTPGFGEHLGNHEFDSLSVRPVASFKAYFERHNVRAGDIIFLDWTEFDQVSEGIILQAGEIGVRFGISFANDINPKHRILQNLRPCKVIRSTDSEYLKGLVGRALATPTPDPFYR